MHYLSKVVLFIIKIYQVCISPLSAPQCKFYPTCSHYAVDAVKEYGALKGSYYALVRIAKCGPFTNGGYDPIEHIEIKSKLKQTKKQNKQVHKKCKC